MPKGPSSTANQANRMRQSFGNFDSESLEGQAAQSAFQQKTAQQKGGNTAVNQTNQSAQSTQQQPVQARPQKPREVGSLSEELVTRPLHDIKEAMTSFFDLNSLLNISYEDSPEEQAKKREMIRRYQQLTDAEKEEAKKKYELRMRKKQEEEKQKEIQRKQIEEQKKATIVTPSGKSDKPGLFVAGQSNKAKSQNKLQQQMKTMGTVADGG